MLNDIIGQKTVCIVTGYTDMRKGIDGLATIVKGKLSLDPYNIILSRKQMLRSVSSVKIITTNMNIGQT